MPRKRKNEKIQAVVSQLQRNGYTIYFRGFPTFWAVKEDGGIKEAFPVYVRRKFKADKKRDPQAGLSSHARQLITLFRALGVPEKVF